jgi:3-phenylpropionate/trans-cinnamate dioxygenase ferredoxin reductase subunit
MAGTRSNDTFVIIGGGLAGAKAAEELRTAGFDGRVVLLAAERELPYERPPLSKGYLNGSDERDSIFVHPAPWYDEQAIDLRLGTAATALDVSAHEVHLASGERIAYTKALLATGSSPRKLPLPGADLDGVHYLRRVSHAERLRAALEGGGKKVVVVGAGWIGLETAAAARTYGNDVTVLEPAPTPLHAALGDELGAVFAGLHRDHDVDLRTGVGVSELLGKDGRLTAVMTANGEELPADLAIIGVGARPNTELAEAAGLSVDNGVLADASLATDNPDVFVAGDIANFHHPLLDRRIRVEHWANALNSGPVAARAMLGEPVQYDAVPYFFTDQYDLGMEYAGYAGPGDYDRVVYRGDPASREFIAFWMSGDRLVAGMNVNIWDVSDPIQAMIRQRTKVTDTELTDPDVDLASLASA